MKNKQIIDSWKKIEPDASADERILETIIDCKHKLYEKKERRTDFLLCVIQLALFAMTLFLTSTIFILNQKIAGIVLICYLAAGCFICVFLALSSGKNKKLRKV